MGKKIVFDLEKFKKFLTEFDRDEYLNCHPKYDEFQTRVLLDDDGIIFVKRWGVRPTINGDVTEVINERWEDYIQGDIIDG